MKAERREKMANSTKHIRELCDQKNIDYKKLHQLILKKMEDDNNYDYLDPSIVNKWYNCKTKSIDEKYAKYVAEALDVPEDEIRLGKPIDSETEFESIKKKLELSENEKDRIAKILYLDRYYLRLLSLIFASIGVFLLNATIWKNGLIYLAAIIVLISAFRYDEKKYFKETGQKKKNAIENMKDNVERSSFF